VRGTVRDRTIDPVYCHGRSLAVRAEVLKKVPPGVACQVALQVLLELRHEWFAPTAVKVELDRVANFLRRNEIHAGWKSADRVDAQMFRLVFLVAISERHGTRAPAAAVGAARKSADGVQKLVPGIRLPRR
jgi:hypothetical protein